MSASPRIRRPPRKTAGEFLKVWGPLLALVAVGFAIAVAKLEPPPPRSFRIAAGEGGGAYHAYAERYRQILAADGFDLEDLSWADEILHEEPTAEEVSAHLEMLTALEREVARVEVPLSYMDEYYNLRVHIRMIAGQLEALQARRGDGEAKARPA